MITSTITMMLILTVTMIMTMTIVIIHKEANNNTKLAGWRNKSYKIIINHHVLQYSTVQYAYLGIKVQGPSV